MKQGKIRDNFHLLLGFASSTQPTITIYFINPDVKEVKTRCLSLLDKHFERYCDYKEFTFSKFIGDDSFIKDKLNRLKVK